jgi:hypothetical protein
MPSLQRVLESLRRCRTFCKNAFENSAVLDILIPLLAFPRFKRMILFPKARRLAKSIPKASRGNLLTHQFEPAFPKLDRTGLELRKSLPWRALRFPGKESIVTKRVALGEPKFFLRKKRQKVNF